MTPKKGNGKIKIMLFVASKKFNRENHILVDTTASSDNWSRELSPFRLGPIVTPKGTALRLENLWQFTKVYEEHIEENGEPNKQWYQWKKEGFDSFKAQRYPMGRDAIPEYFWWNKQKLSLVEARKKIYIPHYENAVLKTRAWKELCHIYEKAKKRDKPFVLLDFDGYDHLTLHMTFDDVVNDKDKPFSHSFVLYKMLLEKFSESEPKVSLF